MRRRSRVFDLGQSELEARAGIVPLVLWVPSVFEPPNVRHT